MYGLIKKNKKVKSVIRFPVVPFSVGGWKRLYLYSVKIDIQICSAKKKKIKDRKKPMNLILKYL